MHWQLAYQYLLYLPSKNLASPTISFYFIFPFFRFFDLFLFFCLSLSLTRRLCSRSFRAMLFSYSISNSHRNVAHTVSYYKYHRHRFWHIFNLTVLDLLTFMRFLQSSNKYLNFREIKVNEIINRKKIQNKTELKYLKIKCNRNILRKITSKKIEKKNASH